MKTLDVVGVKPKVLEILGENPALSYSFIANEVGVTRERVRQIARKNGYPSRQGLLKPKICPMCGKTFYKKINRYCSPACGYRSRRKTIVLNCHQCGRSMERRPGTMRNGSGRYFCDKACYYRSRKTTIPVVTSFLDITSIPSPCRT